MLLSIGNHIKNRYRRGGFMAVLYKILEISLRNLWEFFLNCYFKLIPGRKFFFQGLTFRYFRRAYNRTWENERTVEIPIIYKFIKQNRGKNILEIGNVLSNYYPSLRHDIVDKYEKAPRVINKDAVDFKPTKLYDVIISVSTLEHVGYDEDEKSPEKILKATRHLIDNCLSPGGTFVAAVPLGYNPNLDNFIKRKELGFDQYYYLKRVSTDNRWIEIPEEKAFGAKFGDPFPNGNVEVICVAGLDIFKEAI